MGLIFKIGAMARWTWPSSLWLSSFLSLAPGVHGEDGTRGLATFMPPWPPEVGSAIQDSSPQSWPRVSSAVCPQCLARRARPGAGISMLGAKPHRLLYIGWERTAFSPRDHRPEIRADLLPAWKPLSAELRLRDSPSRRLPSKVITTGCLAGGFRSWSTFMGVFSRILETGCANKSSSPADGRSNLLPPIRWVNQWDNFDGSIERGYGRTQAIFFRPTDHVAKLNLSRVFGVWTAAGVGRPSTAATVNNVKCQSAYA